MQPSASCPRCRYLLGRVTLACPRCGFALIEERPLVRRPPSPRVRSLLLAAATLAAAITLRGGLAPASTPLSGAEAERLLAQRYPRLRHVPDAVIACPRRRIEPGGEIRCWILPRVGQQRAAVVRLSSRGNRVQIDD